MTVWSRFRSRSVLCPSFYCLSLQVLGRNVSLRWIYRSKLLNLHVRETSLADLDFRNKIIYRRPDFEARCVGFLLPFDFECVCVGGGGSNKNPFWFVIGLDLQRSVQLWVFMQTRFLCCSPSFLCYGDNYFDVFWTAGVREEESVLFFSQVQQLWISAFDEEKYVKVARVSCVCPLPTLQLLASFWEVYSCEIGKWQIHMCKFSCGLYNQASGLLSECSLTWIFDQPSQDWQHHCH